ncbi:MAG: amino acid ABC transporter permease [Erysipelotrichaceae bacterium]|jgi:putative lysine transport system permease protein|nr:amino acid ABC transporter permease [Bacillota bacterium]
MIALIESSITIFNKYWPSFLYGLQYTLLISFVGTGVGLIIGLLIGGFRAIKIENSDSLIQRVSKKIFFVLSSIYIEVFRGTPMMVQAVFIYHALRTTLNWTPLIAGMFIISINTGAYMSEIVRAGIQAVDSGQSEAARSLGMSSSQTMLLVVIPQAIKNTFPSIGNELIVNIKDSSVLNVISVTELFFQSNSIAGTVFKYKETFLVTAIIYLILTIICSRILGYIEQKMNQTKSSYPSSDTSIANQGL